MKRILLPLAAALLGACSPTPAPVAPKPVASIPPAASSSAPKPPEEPPNPAVRVPEMSTKQLADGTTAWVVVAPTLLTALVIPGLGAAEDGERTGLAMVVAEVLVRDLPKAAAIATEDAIVVTAERGTGLAAELAAQLAKKVDDKVVQAAREAVRARVRAELALPEAAARFVARRHLYQLPTSLHPYGASRPLPGELDAVTTKLVVAQLAKVGRRGATWLTTDGAHVDALSGVLPDRSASPSVVTPPAPVEPKRFVVHQPGAKAILHLAALADGAVSSVAQSELATRWALARAGLSGRPGMDPFARGPAYRAVTVDLGGDPKKELAALLKALGEAPLGRDGSAGKARRAYLGELAKETADPSRVLARLAGFAAAGAEPAPPPFATLLAEGQFDDDAVLALHAEKHPFEPLAIVAVGDADVLAPLLAEGGDVNVLDPERFARLRTVPKVREPVVPKDPTP